MSFLSFLAPVVGSVLGGLLGNQGSQQAAQTAGNDALAQSQQAFNDYTGYAKQQQQGLQSFIQGQQNPFIAALAQLQKPNPNANTYTPVGMSGVPMYGGSGAPAGGAAAGTPTGAAAGGTMPSAVPNPFARIAAMRQTQPVARSAAAQ